MAAVEADGRGLLEWSVASEPVAGERMPGDRAVVVEAEAGNLVLVAAVDGLGHGPAAAEAARTATDVLAAYAGESVVTLAERCHEALRTTRGVALSLATFSADDGTMSWLGIGNVEGRVARPGRAQPALVLRPGLAGHELPLRREETMEVRLGDTLVLATDGIDGGFADNLDVSGSTREIADRLLAEGGTAEDDALVVVARYLGRAT